MTLLDRYLFRQLALALLAVTVGLAALVWLTQSLRFIELVLDRGLSLAVFFELTSLLLPSFFSVILPITTFIVMLFVHLRLAGDRELVVMRAAGLSNWQIARPALALGLLVVAVMALLNFWLVPLSHTAFRQWQFEIRNQLVGVLLQEGVFSTLGNDLTVYARKREADGTLRGILVHDQREAGGAVTILAQAGRIGQGPEGPRVTLYDGVRQQMERGASGAPPRLTVLSFSENSVDLARVARNEETRNRDSRERSVTELLNPDPAEGLRPPSGGADRAIPSPWRRLRRCAWHRHHGCVAGAWPDHQQCSGQARWADLADLAACHPAGGDFRLVAGRRPGPAAPGPAA